MKPAPVLNRIATVRYAHNPHCSMQKGLMQLRAEFYDVLNYKKFYVLAGASNADVSSTYTCPGGGSVASCGTPIVPSGAGFTTTAKKGGFGNRFDDHRNTELAIRFNF